MTEYLVMWRKVLQDRGMMVCRPKIQFLDFAFTQNDQENRESIKILEQEPEILIHFKYLGTCVDEKGGMEMEFTKQTWTRWRN